MHHRRRAEGLAPAAGIGLKPQHYRDIHAGQPDIGFLEIHAENYMGAGGPPHAWLERLRAHYQLSVHGVGLSIGGDGPLDRDHLARLKTLLARYEPESFSEHLAWSTHDGIYLDDLLPVPYDGPTLARVCEHVDAVQETLGRRMLLENPRPTSPSRPATAARSTSCARLSIVPAVACCSTSTMSSSRRRTTPIRRRPISTPSPTPTSARSTSRGTPRTRTTTARRSSSTPTARRSPIRSGSSMRGRWRGRGRWRR